MRERGEREMVEDRGQERRYRRRGVPLGWQEAQQWLWTSFGSLWGGPLTAHLEAPQKRMGVSWGRKEIFQGCQNEAAGWTGHPHTLLPESAGLFLSLFKAWPGHTRPNVGRRVEMAEPWGQG